MNREKTLGALSAIFGFGAFRPHQEEIVDAVLSGQDVFAVMPTGGGKSLCYQLPACLRHGVAVVVSPLISLMKDQVDAANANGIAAASLNSAVADSERAAVRQAIRRGDLKLLYISPERFNAPGFLEYLKSIDISFFAVDEAHCISEWGHDFRPDYLALSAMTREFPDVAVAAFTATATPKVADDIVSRLGLRNPHLTRASFNRPNLVYRAAPKDVLDRQLLEFVRGRADESGIVYRTTRKNVEATAAMLGKNGVSVRAYHAGLSDAERKDAQEAFRNDRCQVVVATIAFGMGIDKPNVRYVVHGDLPKNIEGYYQETGRAGRDGEPAQCMLFHSLADMAQLLRFAAGIEDGRARETAERQLRSMAAFARTDVCRRAALLRYFGEEYPEGNCGGCDVCLGEVEREDATVPAQKALSAMARTGGRFGAMHIADILVGADTAKIRQNRHDRLPTYGVGKGMDKAYWRRVVDALVAKGLAEIADPEFPTPSVTEAGWRVMRGEAGFEMMKLNDGKAGRKGRSGSRAERAGAGTDEPYSKGLFARLRKLRTELAEERNVPPYVIFPDKTLQEMARRFPERDEELLGVTGVGQHKLKSYGDAFVKAIAGYLDEHPEERPKLRSAPAVPASPVCVRPAGNAPPAEGGAGEGLSETMMTTREYLLRGFSIGETAEKRGLKPQTVLMHMERLVDAGYVFKPEMFFRPERLDMIRRLFEQSGSILLRPVVDASAGEVDYSEARLARLFLERGR